MSYSINKQNILNKISGIKSLNDRLNHLKLKKKSTWSNINLDDNNSFGFLSDLIKEIGGYGALKDGIIDFLSNNITLVEEYFKDGLKKILKSFFSCGINVSVPQILYDEGINISVKELDFFNILENNPNDNLGRYYYYDNNNGINSLDPNTFFYHLIRTNNYQNLVNTGFKCKYFENNNIGTGATEYINVKFTQTSLGDEDWFNICNNYIDNLQIFQESNVIYEIFKNYYSQIQNKILNKDLELEFEIETIIEKMLNDNVIDDSFFNFKGSELIDIRQRAKMKKHNSRVVKQSGRNVNKINNNINNVIDDISEIQNVTYVEKLKKIEYIIDSISTSNNKEKNNLYNDLIKKLYITIIKQIFSPRVFFIIILNYKIVNYNNNVDRRKILRAISPIIKEMCDIIKGLISAYFLELLFQKLSELLLNVNASLLREKVFNRKKQLLSLMNINPNILNVLKKF